MKALLLKELNELVYTDVPTPTLKNDGDVLVEIKACGICGSDVHGLDGSTRRRIPPIIMGHECTGVVKEIGRAVKTFRPGDRVAMEPSRFCGACEACRSGRTNLCKDKKVTGISCEEYKVDGAYADYLAVPERSVHRLPDSLSFEEGTLLEPLTIAQHGVNLSGFRPGMSAAVAGCGTIGLMAIQVLRAYGCECVVAIDRNDHKLQLAERFGATALINTRGVRDVPEAVRKITGGCHVAFECIGLAATTLDCLMSLRDGGVLSMLGLLEQQATLPIQYMVSHELSVVGSFVFTSSEFEKSIAMIAEGKVNPGALISATAPLSEGAGYFQKLKNKEDKLIKVVLTR